MKTDLVETEAACGAVEVERQRDPRTRMETLIGITLLAGVLASTFVVLLGGLIYVSRHASMTVDYRVFRGEPSGLRSVPGVGRELRALSGEGLIQFGLMLLVGLQVVRMAMTGVLFLISRDRVFVAITAIVLALLAYGLIFESAVAH